MRYIQSNKELQQSKQNKKKNDETNINNVKTNKHKRRHLSAKWVKDKVLIVGLSIDVVHKYEMPNHHKTLTQWLMKARAFNQQNMPTTSPCQQFTLKVGWGVAMKNIKPKNNILKTIHC